MKRLARLFTLRRRTIVGACVDATAEAVEAALVEVEMLPRPDRALAWELADFIRHPVGDAVRSEIEAVRAGGPHALERLTRLHYVLGGLLADAVEGVAADAGTPIDEIDAVAAAGPALCRFPSLPVESGPDDEPLPGSEAWGRRGREGAAWVSPSLLEIGEPAVIAERTGLPVLSAFRAADVAAGGTGSPLGPVADHALFGDVSSSRLIVHVGAETTLSALPAACGREDVSALAAGPGMRFLDAVAATLTGGRRRLADGGAAARAGRADAGLVAECLAAPFFSVPPPRVPGEESGPPGARGLVEAGRVRRLGDASIAATAAAFVAATIHAAWERFIVGRMAVDEVVVCGRGAHDVVLLEALARFMAPVRVVPSDYHGLDVDARDAAGLALLAHLSLDDEAGSVPGATGARRAVVLGSLTPGGRR